MSIDKQRKITHKKFEYIKNKAGKILTNSFCYGIILGQTERYRSGHNGTVLKTVVRLVRTVGSNPTLSATEKEPEILVFQVLLSKTNISRFRHGGLLKW